jgi:thiamine-phosphate pyrophosphorylase
VILYYITDRKQLPGNAAGQWDRLLATIRHCAEAGVDMVQIREKDLSPRDLERLGREAMACVAGSPTRLLVNGRIDVAIAIGAHGVHLPSGQEQLSPSEARVVFDKAQISDPSIGVSCHSVEEIAYAEAHGADFAVFGPVFEKAGTPNLAGLAALGALSTRPGGPNSKMPILALGGVTRDNAEQALMARAAGVAGIRLFQDEAKLADLVQHLRGLAKPQRSVPFRHPYQP